MDNSNPPIWRSSLEIALAEAKYLNQGQRDSVMARYDTMTKKCSGSLAFRTLCESYANCDTNAAVSAIHAALEKANKEIRIESNPLQRLRALIARHNANVCKMDCTIDGISALTAEEREKVKMKLPGFLKEETFLATASTKGGKKMEFGISVKF